MDIMEQLYGLRPSLPNVQSIFKENSNSELTIFSLCYKLLDSIDFNKKGGGANRALLLVEALKDKLYEIINTGHWSKVDTSVRKAYTLATFLSVYFRLLQLKQCDEKFYDKCLYDLDYGLLVGCPLEDAPDLLTTSIQIISESLVTNEGPSPKKVKFSDATRQTVELSACDIAILSRPSLEEFQQNHFLKRQPALLLDCIHHWPALTKWRQPDYLVKIAGERTVPIEIGKHYTNEEWSQDLVKFKEFLQRQIATDEPCDRIEYLAQHNLFDQIPALRRDITIPEYCCISADSDPPDIKAWLGPKGTISPLHHDPKHNLLCQVFGHKYVILAGPKDSINLYPHDGAMLGNTSQVDAENIDMEQFPLLANVKFYRFTLYRGEMLYIPPGWWHYIRSMDKSFSVSFWWE